MTVQSAARHATPELVAQLIRDVRAQIAGRRFPEPLVIGARAHAAWNDADTQIVVERVQGAVTVAPCPTPLATRWAIAEFTQSDPPHEATLVVLTELTEAELGADLMARFVRPRLLPLNAWNAVMQRFGVRQLDPAFNDSRFAWMADALLDIDIPAQQQWANTTLSMEHALQALAHDILGSTSISLEQLLVATARRDFQTRVTGHRAETVGALCDTLAERLGPAGALVLGAIRNGRGESAVAAGLASRCVASDVSGTFAQAKIADMTGVEHPDNAALSAWARSAEFAYAELSADSVTNTAIITDFGSRLVEQWQCPNPAATRILRVGFEARLGRIAELLRTALTDEPFTAADDLRSALAAVQDHEAVKSDEGRAQSNRAHLATRLVAWLRDPISAQHGTGAPAGSEPLTLTDTAAAYIRDGAWVDLARRRVGEGDDQPAAFAAVLREISVRAHEQRSDGNRAFAQALARWTTHGEAADLKETQLVAVEDILARVAAPLATLEPVLLVVLDGCGLAAFLELSEQFRDYGLQEIGRESRLHALAALPTITSVSRTSLLTGRLCTGGQADERTGLPAHPAVAKLPGAPAVVFHHRPDLVTGIGESLPDHVRDAIGTGGPRLVAAVVNTIDDELSHGSFNPEYRIANLGPLPRLLRAAASAGRAVIVTADHGHVLGVGLDGKGVTAAGVGASEVDGGNRWRYADAKQLDEEVFVRGPRVLVGDDAGLFLPWPDDLRYGTRQGGYHGGATPDECIVPLAVFRPTGSPPPKGWESVAVASPAWWDLHVDASAPPTPAPKPRRSASPSTYPGLFDPDQLASPTTPPASGPAWIDELFASETYTLQVDALRRATLDADWVRATLTTLHERGGTANFAVIAQAANTPLSRVQGFLQVLTRVLNVDGYGVLTIDASGQEARLDELQLRRQFLSEGAQ